MPKSKVILDYPTILDKDLTKQHLCGWADKSSFSIEIDKGQLSREYLDTLIHEILHCMLPCLSEKMITRMANILSAEIWRRGFRRLAK